VAQLDGTEAAHPVDEVSQQQDFAAFFERARRLKPQHSGWRLLSVGLAWVGVLGMLLGGRLGRPESAQ
jgi:hypothetical protein